MYSTKWKSWKATTDLKTCLNCRKENGKIYSINESVYPTPPLHPNCRCVIERLKTLLAGTATNQGFDGADWQLRFYGKLPDYYITPEQATSRGWKPKKGNLFLKCPGKMIFVVSTITKTDIYQLPQTEFGTRQTLIMNLDIGEHKEYCFQTMD